MVWDLIILQACPSYQLVVSSLSLDAEGFFFFFVSRSWSFLLTVVLSDFGVLVRGGPSTLPSRLQHLGFSIVF